MLGRKRRDEEHAKLRSESTGSQIPQNPVRPVKQNAVRTDKKSLEKLNTSKRTKLLKIPNLQQDLKLIAGWKSGSEASKRSWTGAR